MMKFRRSILSTAVAAIGAWRSQLGFALGALAKSIDKAAWEKLAKDVQALYTEKEGKYVLDVEGEEDVSGLKSALDKERKAAKDAAKAHSDLQKKFEGIDADEVRGMLEKLGGDEEAALIKAGNVDKVVEKRMAKAQQAHEKALQQAQAATEAANNKAAKYAQQVLDNHIRAAATKVGLHANAVDDALFRGRTLFALDDEGNAVQLKDGEVVMGKDSKMPFSPGEWLEGMKESAPHWFPAGGSGSGASGGKGGGNGKVIKRAAFQSMSPVEQANTAKEAREGKVLIVE
jgi:hypothetical protein